MNKFVFATLAVTLMVSTPVLAATTEADVNADAGAVAKDNTAISKHRSHIRHHRAKKAAAKAKGDVATQAGESVQLGAEHSMVGEKKVEKNVDQKILEHDQNQLNNNVQQ